MSHESTVPPELSSISEPHSRVGSGSQSSRVSADSPVSVDEQLPQARREGQVRTAPPALAQPPGTNDPQRKSTPHRGRAFVFTHFPASYEEAVRLRGQLALHLQSHCRYACMGIERCPTTGKVHIQGYCAFPNPKRFGALRKMFFDCLRKESRFENAKGSDLDNRKYCSKEEDFLEIGEASSRSGQDDIQRSDLRGSVEGIEGSTRLADFAQENPFAYVKYHAGIEKLITIYSQEKPRPVPTVLWLWGPTGSGKSAWAYEFMRRFPPACSVKCTGGKGFFNGLKDGARTIIMDDFRKEDASYQDLLTLTDRYPTPVNTKGSYAMVVAEYIVITCTHKIRTCFGGITESTAQLVRRVAHEVEFPIPAKSVWRFRPGWEDDVWPTLKKTDDPKKKPPIFLEDSEDSDVEEIPMRIPSPAILEAIQREEEIDTQEPISLNLLDLNAF